MNQFPILSDLYSSATSMSLLRNCSNDSLASLSSSSSALSASSPSSQMRKKLVFVLTGQAHSGKDTFYRIAADELKRCGNLRIEHGSFAAFLKILCRDWLRLFYGLDIPMTHFEDPVEKEREYAEYRFNGQPLKIRNVLQYMGTDVFRDQISPTFWVEQLYKRQIEKSEADIFFITDCRFPNEIEYLQSMGCQLFILKIVRTVADEHNLSSDNQKHKSEQLMGAIPYHHLFENSFSSIQEYHKHIIEWIHSAFIDNTSRVCPMFLNLNYII